MILALVLASAIAPSLLLIWFFTARDRNPEPARVVWATFGLGVACLIPEVLVALPITRLVEHVTNPYARGMLDALLTAALPEELFKLLVVWLYASRHREFDEPMDGLVYGAVASLGFATLENIVYVVGQPSLAALRALSAVPGHACMGAVMGYFVGQARFGAVEARRRNWASAFIAPVVLHTLYDFPLLTMKTLAGDDGAGGHKDLEVGAALSVIGLLLLALGTLVFEIVWVLRLVKKLRATQVVRVAPAAMPSFGPMLVGGVPAMNVAPMNVAAMPPMNDAAMPPMNDAAMLPMNDAAVPPMNDAAMLPMNDAVVPPMDDAAISSPVPMVRVAPPQPALAAMALGPRVATTPSTGGGAVAGWLLTVFGAVLVTFGLFICLAMASLIIGGEQTEDLGAAIVGTVILGVIPLGIGTLLFALGLRRLSRRRP